MKVLLVNKFLYPKGGAETYTFKLGETLMNYGHEVQYFGLENSKNVVGNYIGEYVSDMDFNKGILKNLTAPFRIIFSYEAKKKISKVLYDFEPDVVHMNNIQFHLTPSIILAVANYRKNTGRRVKIVYTAHDYQLVCPNHMCRNPNTDENCEKCISGSYVNCIKGKCIHNSSAKSVIGATEAYFWKLTGVYKQIDTIICCSRFMKSKLDTNPVLAKKTLALHKTAETS